MAFALLLPLAAGAETPQEPAAAQKPAAKKPGTPKPEQKGRVPAAMLAEAPMATWMRDGQSKHVIYVFFDPNCPYCHKTYALFDALAKEGPGFKVHYIPIGILGPRSENEAKGLLGMRGEAQVNALAGLMTGKAATMSNEAIGAGDKAHQQNMAIFRNLQFDAVPVTVMRMRKFEQLAQFFTGMKLRWIGGRLIFFDFEGLQGSDSARNPGTRFEFTKPNLQEL